MNLDSLNKWLTLSANAGVIAGIVFLAIEISQNTIAIRAEIYQTRSYEVADANRFRAESEYIIPIWAKVRDESGRFDPNLVGELTFVEKERLWAATESGIRLYDNNMYQCAIGFHEETFCSEFRKQIRDAFPEWQAIAASVGSQVNPAFTFLYEVLEQDF
jgi:hypothetical protein